ncbi:MAG: DUF5597 domain-containing protein [Bacteroidales bacterium]|nr:DUF5597 domain-containing protein [Bacteroidales bacterium]
MRRLFLSLIASGLLCLCANAQPQLDNHGDWARIVANGKPMLMIGGELGNSSASTLDDVKRIFPHLKKLGLNTVLAPVTWELIEPREGVYDFTSVDNIITEARKNDLKVVVLWFGAWKNSMSCYAPEWFKRDTKRFPRVHDRNGIPMEEASSLSAAVLEADKKIFCKLMQHIRDVDSEHQTVIMIQVENEIGMIKEPRDYSTDATKMYNSQVPKTLTDYLIRNSKTLNNPRLQIKGDKGSWADMFGNDMYAEEIFQAWTYAVYVEQVAKAGKAIYNLPMYVNVALNSRNRKPGEYPSAGPLAHLIDIWHCGAPSIAVLGLDLYDKGFPDWTAKYHLRNNPLFIPEIRLEDQDGMRALYAFGHHDAMGFCPFSIEDYPFYANASQSDWNNIDLSQDDQLNAFSSAVSVLSPLVASYRLLRQVEPIILKHQGSDDMDAVILDNENREAEIITPDGITLRIRHSYSLGWEPGAKSDVWPEAACIIIRQGKEDYLAIGSGVVITYSKPNGKQIGLAKCEQVEFGSDGGMHILRHLSGDQTHQGRHVRIPVGDYQIQHFRLYEY